jgi:Outer membrane protein beta-barrel domain
MKKNILLTIVALVMINNIYAQERTIKFGFKAGTNYSDAYDQKGVSFNTIGKFGAVAGAYLAVCIGDYVCVQPELLFSQKGFKATGKVNGNNFDVTRTTNYLDMPLLIALKPNEFVSVVFGPQYSYLLNQKSV